MRQRDEFGRLIYTDEEIEKAAKDYAKDLGYTYLCHEFYHDEKYGGLHIAYEAPRGRDLGRVSIHNLIRD